MKIIRHGNGIIESQRKGRSSFGFDARINGTRFRRVGWLTKNEAELALVDSRTAGEAVTDRVAGCGRLKIGAVGAIAELVVCADLLEQGYDVFRSVSNNAACDVVAANDEGQLCRIEVKSAITRNGSVRFKRHRFDQSKHDVLALVFLREQQIDYSISLDKWFKARKSVAI